MNFLLYFFTFIAILIVCCVNGCAHHTNRQSKTSVPQQIRKQEIIKKKCDNNNWWEFFRDPILNDLINKALLVDNDVATATLKVKRAQLQSALTNTNLMPKLTIFTNSSVEKLNNRFSQPIHRITGEQSYEIDLWGKLSSERLAASLEAEATKADLDNITLSLVGKVASLYWQITYLNQLVAINKASIIYAQKLLDVSNSKYYAGEVSSLEIIESQQNIIMQKNNLSKSLKQLTEVSNELTILFNQEPKDNNNYEWKNFPMDKLPRITEKIPVSTIRQYPDLYAAELRLRKCLADVHATKAQFYPTFSLTGNLGNASTTLMSVIQNPVITLGAGLILPFIQWNTTKLTIKVSETKYEEAVINFRQSLYKALYEVKNVLCANIQYQKEEEYLNKLLDLAKKIEKSNEIRYKIGKIGIQPWIESQTNYLNVKINVLENRFNRLKTLITLYQFLGSNMIKYINSK